MSKYFRTRDAAPSGGLYRFIGYAKGDRYDPLPDDKELVLPLNKDDHFSAIKSVGRPAYWKEISEGELGRIQQVLVKRHITVNRENIQTWAAVYARRWLKSASEKNNL